MNPFTLPPHHIPSLRRWLLGALMSIANRQREPSWYQLKAKLLPRFGMEVGYDLQIVKNKCWNCDGTGCRRCSSGVYSITRTKLQRWSVGGWVMHTPVKTIHFREEFDALTPGAHSVIHHRIRHWGTLPKLSPELQLWFLLLFDPASFRLAFRCRCYCYPLFYPLLTLQKIFFWLRVEIPANARARALRRQRLSLGAAYTNDIPF